MRQRRSPPLVAPSLEDASNCKQLPPRLFHMSPHRKSVSRVYSSAPLVRRVGDKVECVLPGDKAEQDNWFCKPESTAYIQKWCAYIEMRARWLPTEQQVSGPSSTAGESSFSLWHSRVRSSSIQRDERDAPRSAQEPQQLETIDVVWHEDQI